MTESAEHKLGGGWRPKPHVVPLGPTPVFNCVAIVSPRDAAGQVRVRIANLDGIEAMAASEREGLQQVVAEFKRRVGQSHGRHEPIPFREPAEQPAPGETLRMIAVHL